MENMEYYTQRLQCSDAEKDACLETVAKVYQLRGYLRQNGFLVAEVLAEKESDSFFRVGLLEFADLYQDPDGLERLLSRYLMAGDYRGGAFLSALIICRGLVMLARGIEDRDYFGGTDPVLRKDWYDAFSEGIRGYFGVEYREKVVEAVRQAAREQPKQPFPSLVPEFDSLTKLSPAQRDWLVRRIPERTLRYALKVGGSEVSEFLMAGMEDRTTFEAFLSATCNVRSMDVDAAQREILEMAKEILECM